MLSAGKACQLCDPCLCGQHNCSPGYPQVLGDSITHPLGRWRLWCLWHVNKNGDLRSPPGVTSRKGYSTLLPPLVRHSMGLWDLPPAHLAGNPISVRESKPWDLTPRAIGNHPGEHIEPPAPMCLLPSNHKKKGNPTCGSAGDRHVNTPLLKHPFTIEINGKQLQSALAAVICGHF